MTPFTTYKRHPVKFTKQYFLAIIKLWIYELRPLLLIPCLPHIRSDPLADRLGSPLQVSKVVGEGEGF